MKTSFLRLYNEKKMFPLTGKGWVVQRIKHPTRNVGSQEMWTRRFKTKKQAMVFFNKKRRK